MGLKPISYSFLKWLFKYKKRLFQFYFFIFCYEASTSFQQQAMRCRTSMRREDVMRIVSHSNIFNRN